LQRSKEIQQFLKLCSDLQAIVLKQLKHFSQIISAILAINVSATNFTVRKQFRQLCRIKFSIEFKEKNLLTFN